MNKPKCPGCQQSDIRKLDGQRAVCRSCSTAKRCVFQFCWACQREWPRDAPTTGSCVLPHCELRAALLSVKNIDDPESIVNGCPFFRACPGCKSLITHSGEGCPNIECPNCNEMFCFRCLSSGCFDEDCDSDDEDEEFEPKPCVIVDNTETLREMGL